VPGFNTDKDQTIASMQRIADFLAEEEAKLWINHDKPSNDALRHPRNSTSSKAPAGLATVSPACPPASTITLWSRRAYGVCFQPKRVGVRQSVEDGTLRVMARAG
jgi:hypothetical protein